MAFLLKCSSKSSDTTYQFQLTNSGLLDMVGRVESAVPNTKDNSILFQWAFEEACGTSILMATQDQLIPLSSTHLSGLAIIARIEAFVQAGVFFKAAQWIKFKIDADTLLRAWMKSMLGPRICRELFFSFHLEAFGDNEESCLNTSQLMDGPIHDVEQKINKWISSCLCLHTRVAGFGYRHQPFEVGKNGVFNYGLVRAIGSWPSETHMNIKIHLP
ncbi:MAG: hypothetical protein J0665_12095 [Deltaproteobacteria bacterium]|nr:hypothetical protein [Deltaproteobacteria bacterium]